jgi:hypothetical protein
MSTMVRCVRSLTMPSIFGGTSTTTGPSRVRSIAASAYTVSVFPVSNRVAESINVSQITTWFGFPGPALAAPVQTQYSDTVGICTR